MTYIKRTTVIATTDASGNAVAFTEQLEGLLHRVSMTLPQSGGFDNTVDVTITEEDSGVQLLAKTNVAAAFASYPRAPTNDNADAASLYAAGGTAVQTPFPVLGRIKVAVAQGGNVKSGTFIFDLI